MWPIAIAIDYVIGYRLLFEQDAPGQGHYLSLVEVRHTPLRGSGTSKAVDSYHGVSADLDLTTMTQPIHGKGDWGVDVDYRA